MRTLIVSGSPHKNGLIMLGFRSQNPLPVTRYNLDTALIEVKVRGKRMVGVKPQRFSSLAEKVAYYESLPYMKYSVIDEILLLAKPLMG